MEITKKILFLVICRIKISLHTVTTVTFFLFDCMVPYQFAFSDAKILSLEISGLEIGGGELVLYKGKTTTTAAKIIKIIELK